MSLYKMHSTPEACQMLGISRRTIHYWMSNGTAVPSETTPGDRGRHFWSVPNLRRIARTHGRTLKDLT